MRVIPKKARNKTKKRIEVWETCTKKQTSFSVSSFIGERCAPKRVGVRHTASTLHTSGCCYAARIEHREISLCSTRTFPFFFFLFFLLLFCFRAFVSNGRKILPPNRADGADGIWLSQFIYIWGIWCLVADRNKSTLQM